jgi:hypothetical protein
LLNEPERYIASLFPVFCAVANSTSADASNRCKEPDAPFPDNGVEDGAFSGSGITSCLKLDDPSIRFLSLFTGAGAGARTGK